MSGILPFIGILILNHNGRKWLPQVYRSIHQQSYPHRRTYLVDNGSTDDSVELTVHHHPEVTVIRIPQNLGYSMAYNLAMPYAFSDGCDWVILANNDIQLEPGCLEELARIAAKDPKIGVMGPTFLAWEKDEPNYYMRGKYPEAIPAMERGDSMEMDVDWVEGSFLMVHRRCVEAVGPLDPFFFFYWEEADFCRRARLHGWRVVLVPRALARHYGAGSSRDCSSTMKRMDRLRSRNYYIYTLTDPSHGFFQNGLAAIHLFFVKLKQSISRNVLDLFNELVIAFRVLQEIPAIHQKWSRDRRKVHPPATLDDFRSIRLEVLRAKREWDPGPLWGTTEWSSIQWS